MFATHQHIIEQIMAVLEKLHRPVNLDELSFRTRAPREVLSAELQKLRAADIVRSRDAYYFELNRKLSAQNIRRLAS